MEQPKRLFLLDGMALVYRAYFAFAARPILTSQGFNTSALYGYTNTLADLITHQKPTHLAVAFDTAAPTERHVIFKEYKAQRQEMPEDLSASMPHVWRITEAFNIPVFIADGFEADDIIGTLAQRAGAAGFQTYMVTPDKDFGQLVNECVWLYRPSRMGDAAEVWGVPEVLKKWGIEKVSQVIDILALWGDPTDNIPGVPGIGEKTAQKLIAQFGTVENLLEHLSELKGKVRESLELNREQALLSKRLATINCEAPVAFDAQTLAWRNFNPEALKDLFSEFEFNALGRRLLGDDFKTGRGFSAPAQGEFQLNEATAEPSDKSELAQPAGLLRHLADVGHDYRIVRTAADRAALIQELRKQGQFGFALLTAGPDPKDALVLGLAFTHTAHRAVFVPSNEDESILGEFKQVFEDERLGKTGYDLKRSATVLRWHGITLDGPLQDVLLAHSLVEPELRHHLGYLAEALLGYSRIQPVDLLGDPKAGPVRLWTDVPAERQADYTCEAADLSAQLWDLVEPQLRSKQQERVYYEIEAPLIPVLVDMEFEGIALDAQALADVSKQLNAEIIQCEREIHQMAGLAFNLNSPKQLGEVLFDRLKLGDKPKKTKTGQYATNEQTLQLLASKHDIVKRILDYRACSKLKSTYVDLLPEAVWKPTGRIHTTYNQAITSTGRLQSQDPNLQNIPIRTEQGKEIRKAFVPRSSGHILLAADYSQIELRIIAALSRDLAMAEAFTANVDVHTATAAKVYQVPLEAVTPEMRRQAKMVNFGIIYGISSFGLAQRLGISRQEAACIIDQYFRQYPAIQRYLQETIEFARRQGYVQTVTGRRRYIRDINSANATIRSAAERNAINAPIQGTAADMIKIAMVKIHRELRSRRLGTRMLLQVHDELVFDLLDSERQEVIPMVEELMRAAIPLNVPIVVEIGLGRTWLEAH